MQETYFLLQLKGKKLSIHKRLCEVCVLANYFCWSFFRIYWSKAKSSFMLYAFKLLNLMYCVV